MFPRLLEGECAYSSTPKSQSLPGLLVKISIHLNANKPYRFSKYTSHVIQPCEFPKCQRANLHFLDWSLNKVCLYPAVDIAKGN